MSLIKKIECKLHSVCFIRDGLYIRQGRQILEKRQSLTINDFLWPECVRDPHLVVLVSGTHLLRSTGVASYGRLHGMGIGDRLHAVLLGT